MEKKGEKLTVTLNRNMADKAHPIAMYAHTQTSFTSPSETEQSLCLPGSDLDPFIANNFVVMKT